MTVIQQVLHHPAAIGLLIALGLVGAGVVIGAAIRVHAKATTAVAAALERQARALEERNRSTGNVRAEDLAAVRSDIREETYRGVSTAVDALQDDLTAQIERIAGSGLWQHEGGPKGRTGNVLAAQPAVPSQQPRPQYEQEVTDTAVGRAVVGGATVPGTREALPFDPQVPRELWWWMHDQLPPQPQAAEAMRIRLTDRHPEYPSTTWYAVLRAYLYQNYDIDLAPTFEEQFPEWESAERYGRPPAQPQQEQ